MQVRSTMLAAATRAAAARAAAAAASAAMAMRLRAATGAAVTAGWNCGNAVVPA